MSLRVIGGVYGSRVLKTVRGLGTRPLLGQVKQAVFDILAPLLPDAFVWDLFAGSGASGIEALSRGARRVLFVEKNGKALEVLRQNLETLGPEAVERSVGMRGDAWDPPVMHRAAFGASRDDGDVVPDTPSDAAGDTPSDAEVAPDVVFLDPPYAMVAEDPVKSLFRARRLLQRTAKNGCVVFHFESGLLDEDDFDADLDVDLRDWGNSAIAFLWRAGEMPEHLRKRRARGESAPSQ